ncbi:zinc transporter 2 isoform X5 [Nilaparvata lugens]|uniref:zinc transporter 2 isoform X5 n=1 Tax=Nilaparvata lugens TaxID=108931 RepID=UPI00193DC028|nr:zinc transporter 2 isoform X5 [Nilaparvata lugens]
MIGVLGVSGCGLEFGDPALYGSLPGEMDCLGSDAGLANGSSSNKQQKVIFCVHGKPSGCCVTRLQTDPTSPTETITLATSTQTDARQIDEDNRGSKIYCMHYHPDGKCSAVLLISEDELSSGDGSTTLSRNVDTEDHCHKMRQDSVDKVARRKLIIASILCVFFMIAEVIGGVMSNSLAIATDAAHLLTDFASFMISLFALWVAARKPTRQLLFGWHRAEVIGALCSVLTIWVVTGILVYVAVERIIHQQYEIDSTIMLVTSAIGVLVNLIMGCTLHQHSHGHGGAEEHRGSNSINVRAAFIHVLGDFIQSTGVFIASILIYFNGPSWYIIDPICTFLFSILVMITTFTILKDTMLVLMEGMPRGVEYGDVLDTLLSIQHVEKVHNLRIWALSLDKTALAAHIVISPNVSTHDILKAASKKIHSKFNFFEMTLQIEYYQKRDCNQCCDSEK